VCRALTATKGLVSWWDGPGACSLGPSCGSVDAGLGVVGRRDPQDGPGERLGSVGLVVAGKLLIFSGKIPSSYCSKYFLELSAICC